MALGYEIGTIMKRTSTIHSNDKLTVKLDAIEGMGKGFVQVSKVFMSVIEGAIRAPEAHLLVMVAETSCMIERACYHRCCCCCCCCCFNTLSPCAKQVSHMA